MDDDTTWTVNASLYIFIAILLDYQPYNKYVRVISHILQRYQSMIEPVQTEHYDQFL